MYINTFKYTPKDVSCQLCTEYVKKLGCTALRCPWLAERIEAGVVGYREAVLETFPHERRLFQRLNLLIKHYPGSLWSNEQHERRMQYQCAVQGYRRRRDTNAYYAAMYLLTSNDDIYRRTVSHGGAVQFRFHHRQPLCHAGQSRFSRRPLKAVIFHARFREKGFDTDETPPCLHHRSVERE